MFSLVCTSLTLLEAENNQFFCEILDVALKRQRKLVVPWKNGEQQRWVVYWQDAGITKQRARVRIPLVTISFAFNFSMEKSQVRETSPLWWKPKTQKKIFFRFFPSSFHFFAWVSRYVRFERELTGNRMWATKFIRNKFCSWLAELLRRCRIVRIVSKSCFHSKYSLLDLNVSVWNS